MKADELIELPFITKSKKEFIYYIIPLLDCKNYKSFSLRNIEINKTNKSVNFQKITSLASIPLTSKLTEIKKIKSQKDFPIFESVKHKQNKNHDEKIIDTSLAQQMRKEKQEELVETIKFNEERKRQWERALSGKY